MTDKNRAFFEKVFSYYTKNDNETFFTYFDQHVEWTVNGDSIFTGNYKNLDSVKTVFARFFQLIGNQPANQNLRHLVVEGKMAAAYLYDTIVGADGKKHIMEYSMWLEVSSNGKKIVKVDTYADGMQIDKILKACAQKRKSA